MFRSLCRRTLHKTLHSVLGGLLAFGVVSADVRVFADTTPPAAPHAFPLPPAWVQDQTMYEVNLRQFSDTGDVEGLRKQLPRLKTTWCRHHMGHAG